MQAEICDLEWELSLLEKENATQDKSFQHRVSVLRSPDAGEQATRQWNKVLEIREKLKVYSKYEDTHATIGSQVVFS